MGLLDVRGTPYPPYAQTIEQRRRWDWATLIALAVNRQAVDAGSAYPFPDTTFVWHETRAIYQCATIVDGTPEEFESDLRHAVERGLVSPRRCASVSDEPKLLCPPDEEISPFPGVVIQHLPGGLHVSFVDDLGVEWILVPGNEPEFAPEGWPLMRTGEGSLWTHKPRRDP